MTELEHEFLRGLIRAAWPLWAQAAFGVAMVAGYWMWTRVYYAAVDPALRRWLGARLGARVVWVRRGSPEYPDALGHRSRRRFRWSWGIDGERTLRNDASAATFCFLFVTLLGGLWPVAVFLFVALQLKALSYVVFLPVCLAVIGIYSALWAGRNEVAGMR